MKFVLPGVKQEDLQGMFNSAPDVVESAFYPCAHLLYDLVSSVLWSSFCI